MWRTARPARQYLEADVKTHGAYYGVVLNAGLTRDGAFPALSEDDWDVVLRTNLDGFYNVLHPVMMPNDPPPRRWTHRLHHFGFSRADRQPWPGRLQRLESRPDGAPKRWPSSGQRKITVDCVAPGLIDTAMLDENVPVEELMKMIRGRHSAWAPGRGRRCG